MPRTKRKSIISGDIVSSTALNKYDKALVNDSLKNLLPKLKKKFRTFSHLIKGDYLESVIPNPANALTVALIIKCVVKSIKLSEKAGKRQNDRIRPFKTYGIRLAIGYGEISHFDPKEGIIDGEAIYLTGRKISESTTHNKERVIIKNSLFFVSNYAELNRRMEPIMILLDVLLQKATARQCEVLALKLFGHNEKEIAKELGISQSVVNQHSTSAGWNAIAKAVSYFAEEIKRY